MAEGDGEDAVVAFEGGHFGDEGFHRFDGGAPHRDHAAVVIGHDGLDVAAVGGGADCVELDGAFGDVDVGVFLVGDDDIGGGAHELGEVAVEVELDADGGVGAGEFAHAGEGVAFAVLVAVGDHGAVHVEEDDVERQGGLDVGEDHVAQFLVDVAQRGAGGLGGGADAFDDFVSVGFGEGTIFDEGGVAPGGGVLAGAGAVPVALAHEGVAAGGDGGEGVGFGGEGGDQDFHGRGSRGLAGG